MAIPHHGKLRRRSAGGVTGRSKAEWVVRASLSFGVLVLGYLSVTAVAANVIVDADPASAFRLNSMDGRIVAAFSEHEFSTSPDTRLASTQAQLAANALQSDPTAVEALNVLGLQAQMRSDDAFADRAFDYSIQLSRRELQPQIWSIERAVNRGDIDQAIRGYDVALRTSVKAREILFPILATAVAESKIRTYLVPTFVENPIWMKPFFKYAVIQSPTPKAVMRLFDAASAKGVSIGADEKARLVNSLVHHGFMEEAWGYYGSFESDVSPSRSRDADFNFDEGVPTRFDWNLGSASGLSVAILRDGDRGVLDFSIPPSMGATVVTQMQVLPPGTYQLKGRSAKIDQPDRSRPYWLLACYPGQQLGRVELPNSAEGTGSFSGTFTVPTDCSVQMLSLVLRASDRVVGVSGQIENVQLAPVQQ